MDAGPRAATDRVLDLVADRLRTPGPPVLVGIDGPSGSGKSTLARALAARLPDRSVIHLDGVYPGWDGLEAAVGPVAAALADLAAGRPARHPTWDWRHDRPGPPHAVRAAAVVIVEGVGACARACAEHLSVQVWLDAPTAERHRRAMARDGDGYRPHWDRWAAQERAHFAAERTADRADLRLG
jgi:uridine kinase